MGSHGPMIRALFPPGVLKPQFDIEAVFLSQLYDEIDTSIASPAHTLSKAIPQMGFTRRGSACTFNYWVYRLYYCLSTLCVISQSGEATAGIGLGCFLKQVLLLHDSKLLCRVNNLNPDHENKTTQTFKFSIIKEISSAKCRGLFKLMKRHSMHYKLLPPLIYLHLENLTDGCTEV